MRQSCIFSGSSHPNLVSAICERLGQKPSHVELKKFSNGETSVEIKTSVRDQDVFIVQSGSGEINDNVMEMLIMIAACKGGSARSITAVMPYFPYSRQSKKKSHRGAITARMVANLMKVAGVDHVITIDLHASQMQGFFKCPVDNLFAEPILSKWIRMNLPDWWESVVVSKNPGGTKRVTSLADKLGLSFGIVTTDRRKPHAFPSMFNSVIMESLGDDGTDERATLEEEEAEGKASTNVPELEKTTVTAERDPGAPIQRDWAHQRQSSAPSNDGSPKRHTSQKRPFNVGSMGARPRFLNGDVRDVPPSPLARSTRPDSPQTRSAESKAAVTGSEDLPASRAPTMPATTRPAAPTSVDGDGYEDSEGEDDSDERARDVITGRLIHGHIVDEDVPSPSVSMYSGHHGQRHSSEDEPPDAMVQSFMSTTSSRWAAGNGGRHGLGGTGDATASDEEEEEALQNPQIETTVTLVGNVRDKAVLIVDDMIDKAGSWIAAAETVVKRGGATRVYCMATHGLFGGNCLQELEACDEIEAVVVTNAFPIPEEKRQGSRKLVVLDVSGLLAEAIRRNHHGESISHLYHLLD